MSRKNLLSVILFAFLVSCIVLALTSCGEVQDVGTVWHSGEEVPGAELGKNGDFYFETDSYDVWQKTDSGWTVLANIKGSDGLNGETGPQGPEGPQGPQGETGPQGPQGETGTTGPKGETGATGAQGPKGEPGETGATGPQGEKGDAGIEDITKVYIGYGGVLWCDNQKTQITVGFADEDVCEDTIGLVGDMSKVFPGDYLGLSGNSVALMSHYMRATNKTLYSGLTIKEITVFAKNEGTLYIGTAKVEDVVASRKSGEAYTSDGKDYEVVAGYNTITFETPIAVGTDETIVLGGNGSVSLYYAKNVPVDDEDGNISYLNGATNVYTISSDLYADTLAIQVKYDASKLVGEEPIIPEMITDSNGDVVYNRSVASHLTPFAYKNIYDLFENKVITKVGIPVVKVKAIDANQTFTLNVVNVGSSGNIAGNIAASYTLKLPVDQLGTDANNVKKWVYVDTSALNIVVGAGQTVAFGASTDTVTWGYGAPKRATDMYDFFNGNLAFASDWSEGTTSKTGIFFDLYAATSKGIDEHIASLVAENDKIMAGDKNLQLIDALEKKGIVNFSILGDSISTYNGYTNGSAASNTNSTIGSNACWYYNTRGDMTSAEYTWWYQASAEIELPILVNNSYSGDMLGNSGLGLTRCEQLHDDTGANAGTNPDLIAVFFGTNDLGRNISGSTFRTLYTQMVEKMQKKYGDADIFLFTLLPVGDTDVTAAELIEYNNIIHDIAKAKGCYVVDICANSGITWDNYTEKTIDGTHPNQAGMDAITACFIDVLYKTYVGE